MDYRLFGTKPLHKAMTMQCLKLKYSLGHPEMHRKVPLIISWSLGGRLKWYFKKTMKISLKRNAFRNVVWIMVAMLFRPQCVASLGKDGGYQADDNFRGNFLNQTFLLTAYILAIVSLSGVPDYFGRNKILSGYDLSHYQVPHCIKSFLLFCLIYVYSSQFSILFWIMYLL